MILKSIDIQGFKSFPDRTSLQFGQGITAVVGPNGSGKSNISDAVRWVLGEMSTKSLRGQKMEDVIFGGTATRRALGYAEVSLHIDNADRRLPFESDEVQITRRYYRSGDSEYGINRATVRLRDIHELFMDTGLGRDGYSMIGQGKIDSIVASRSEERRDIFEEAAGISRYRYRKTESERRLKAAEENLLRLRDIAQELESRLEPLRQQSEKAQEFLTYSAEKRELEIGLWLISLSKFKEQLRNQEVKIELAKNQQTAAADVLTELETKTEQLQKESSDIIVAIDETRRRASHSEEDAARAEGEIAVQNNNIFHNNETIARLRGDMETLRSSDSDIAEVIAENEAEAERKGIQLEEKKNALAAAQENLITMQSDNAAYSQKIEKISFILNGLSEQTSGARVKMVTAQSSAAELSARKDTAALSLAEHEALLDELEQESSRLSEDLRFCEEKIAENENALKGYEYRRESRAGKVAELKEKADKLRLDASEKSRRAQILEDLEKNMEGFGPSVKHIMRESGHGTLRGIHGPLSRLIKVPSEYSVAVEVALGAAMQNIVVGTEEDAKRAINLLKTGKAGRATFLPLTSIKGRELTESGLDSLYGFVGIASELVECDTKYSEIIKSFLGRVAVAEDLDSAVTIAKKYSYRFKIVTLDGQVINAGGSLTGGSLAKSAGLLSRTSEIERYRRESAELTAKLRETETEQRAAETELAACDADIVAARAELTTAAEDKIRVEGEIRNIAQQLAAGKNNIATLRGELDTADLRLAALRDEEQAAAAEIEKLLETQHENETELRALTGGRDELSAGRERLTEEITAARLVILELEKDILSLRESSNTLSLRREDEAARAGSLQAQIDDVLAENEKIGEIINEFREKVEALRGQSASAGAEIDALNQKRGELELEMSKLRQGEREKLEERERISGELARLEERKLTMVAEYDEIISKLFDEYELTRSEAENIGIEIEDVPAAQKRLVHLKSKIRTLGSVNLESIEEYSEVRERYEFLSAQINDIEKTKAELHRLIKQLTEKMQSLFVEKFAAINKNFSETFVDLFGGGTAQLKMTEPENVLETGIDIIVQPPGKNISIIEQLSGGEKALIATAIYFAIMKVNPPPFCVLDEVEAALDDINVNRFADYLRLMSIATQFIIITHRRGTMEGADVLYGVTMQEKGVSKLLKLDVAEIEKAQLLITSGDRLTS